MVYMFNYVHLEMVSNTFSMQKKDAIIPNIGRFQEPYTCLFFPKIHPYMRSKNFSQKNENVEVYL